MKRVNRWAMLAAAIVLAGCAFAGGIGSDAPWQCDTEGDAAVEAGDWQVGLTTHQRLIADDPSNCLALFHLGYIWGHLSDRAKEIAFYQRALACGYDNDDRLFFNLGMAHAALGQVDAARQALEKAAAMEPGHADNYFGLGLVARQVGSYDAAIDAFGKAIDLDSGHLDARLELIRIYLDLSRWAEARTQLMALEKVAPGHGELPELWETLHRRSIE